MELEELKDKEKKKYDERTKALERELYQFKQIADLQTEMKQKI